MRWKRRRGVSRKPERGARMEFPHGRGMPCAVVALCFTLMLVTVQAARAAAPTFPDPTYQNLRYNDDVTRWAQPGAEPDFWDPLKYVALGDGPYGPSYLSFGGEVRERFESYLNPNFGIHAPQNSAYLLQRLLWNTDLQVTNHLRAFIQLGEMDRLGNRGVTSTTDIDHLDLLQGFVDLTTPGPIGDAPLIRLGREELSFGYERLVAVREGPNVRRTFDGFRFHDRLDGATLDVVAVRPVNNITGVLDDHTNMKQELWGPYLTVPLGPVLKADFYWLNYENEAARFRNLTG